MKKTNCRSLSTTSRRISNCLLHVIGLPVKDCCGGEDKLFEEKGSTLFQIWKKIHKLQDSRTSMNSVKK